MKTLPGTPQNAHCQLSLPPLDSDHTPSTLEQEVFVTQKDIITGGKETPRPCTSAVDSSAFYVLARRSNE